MAQQESWEDLPKEQQAAPTPTVPRWLLFCGCGCLFAILAVAGAIGFTVFYLRSMVDAERQLPRLAAIVPFDEPLEGLEFVLRIPVGLDSYILRDPLTDGGYMLMFTRFADPEAARRAREKAFDPEHKELVGGIGRRDQVQPGTIEVQGRSLELARYLIPAGAALPTFPGGLEGPPGELTGAALVLDVTPPGTPGVVLLDIFRAAGGEEPIPDEYVRRALTPFHVGPDR